MLKFTYVGCDLEHRERTGDDMQSHKGEKKEDLTKVFVEEVKDYRRTYKRESDNRVRILCRLINHFTHRASILSHLLIWIFG